MLLLSEIEINNLTVIFFQLILTEGHSFPIYYLVLIIYPAYTITFLRFFNQIVIPRAIKPRPINKPDAISGRGYSGI